MKLLRKISVITAFALLPPFAASAQSLDEIRNLSREDRKAYMESMSEDERAAMREKWRAEYENLSDEEKQARRMERSANRDARREAMRERWASMSEEERAAAREKRHERKGADDRHHKGRRNHEHVDGEGDSSGEAQ